jgi:hypothetical protein
VAGTGRSATGQSDGYVSTARTNHHPASTVKAMRCLHCINYNMKDYPSHARVGYGRCMAADLQRDGAVFMSVVAEVDCDAYSPAKDGVVFKREEWYESRKGR